MAQMKNFLNIIGAWTIKHHWIFLLIIFGGQWLTGQYMNYPLARQLHLLNSQVIFILLIYMAAGKLWLYLKRKGKI